MKADISRDTFHAVRDIRRVVAQQGRPWLDADWNEQIAVLLHRLETLAADIFGEHAAIGNGFKVDKIIENKVEQPNTFSVARGRYYVRGLMCENDALWEPPSDATFDANSAYLVYLHAWEQYEAGVEDPASMEPALRGVETMGRTRVRWHIGWQKEKGAPDKAWEAFAEQREVPPATLSLRVRPDAQDSSGAAGRAFYRGVENTLYRVEVHSVDAKTARIKWARNNGATLVAVSAEGSSVKCPGAGDLDRAFQPNGWIELTRGGETDAPDAHGELHRIVSLDREANRMRLDPAPAGDRRFARPWLNVLDIKLPDRNPAWVPLDEGLEFRIDSAADAELRAGQYWVMPIRTEGGGQVYWPMMTPQGIVSSWIPLDENMKKSAPGAAPHEPDLASHEIGTKRDQAPLNQAHYYGPLAVVSFDGVGKATIKDLRTSFLPVVP